MTEQKQVIPDGYKKTEVGIIPIDWNICTLGDLSERITVGIASSATHAYRMKGIPFLRNQNIKPNRLDTSDVLFISEEYESNFINKRLRTGDLLTARTGYPGTTCVVPEEFNGAQSFTTLITRLKNEVVVSSYLTFYINSEKGQDFFTQNQIGGGQKNVNAATLKQLIVVIPSQEEQNAIAHALSDVDSLITELEKLIAKKQAIKTASMQQLLTGKTRLPEFALREDGTPKGYKQSELGEIPEDWGVSKIQQLGLVITGGTPATAVSSYWNGDIPWVTPTDISDAKSISKTEREITTDGLAVIRKLPANTVLVTCIASIGKNAILRKAGACNQQINAIIPNELINVEFLYYAIEFSKERLKSSAGMTATPIISKALFSDFSLIVPKFEEQNVIATILSDMDEDIQVLQQRLNKTCQIKQGMMQELLTGKTRLVKPEVTV